MVVSKSEIKWTSGGAGPSSVPELGQQLIEESNPLIDSDDEALDRALTAAQKKPSCRVKKEKAAAKQSKYFVVTLRDLRRGPIPLVPLRTQPGRTSSDELNVLLFESDRKTKPDPGSRSFQPSEYDALAGGSCGAFEKMQALPLGSVVAFISPKIMPFRVVCRPHHLLLFPLMLLAAECKQGLTILVFFFFLQGDTSTTLTISPPNAPSVLHVGKAADYGRCEARKSNGHKCRAFVDKRQLASSSSAVVCAVHQGMAMDRSRVARPELAPAGRYAPGQAKNSYHRVTEQDPWVEAGIKAVKPDPAAKDVNPKTRQPPKFDSSAMAAESEQEQEHEMVIHGRGTGGSRKSGNNRRDTGKRNLVDQAEAMYDEPFVEEDWESIFRASLRRKPESRSEKSVRQSSRPSNDDNRGDDLTREEKALTHDLNRQHYLDRPGFSADPADESTHLYDVTAQMGRGKADQQALHAKRKAQDAIVSHERRRRQPIRSPAQAGAQGSICPPQPPQPQVQLRRFDDPDDVDYSVQLAADAFERTVAKGDQLTLYRNLGPASSAATHIMERAQSLIDQRREQTTDERKRKRAELERVRRAKVKRTKQRGALDMSSSSDEEAPEPSEEHSSPPSTSVAKPTVTTPHNSYRLQHSMRQRIGFDPFAGKPIRPSETFDSVAPSAPPANDTVSRLLARTIPSAHKPPAGPTPSLKAPPRSTWRNVRPPPGIERTGKQIAYDQTYDLRPEDLESDLDLSDEEKGVEL